MNASPRTAVLLAALIVCAAGRATGQAPADTSATEPTRPEEPVSEWELDPEDVDPGRYEEALDRLRTLGALPLNAAPAERLARIPALGPLLAARIVAFRRAYGPFDRIGDLRAVRGMDETTLRRARPFLLLDSPSGNRSATLPSPSSSRTRIRTSTLQRIDRRIDLGRGYRTSPADGGYLGSPVRLVSRIRVDVGERLRLGGTGEKDPGEPMAWHPEARLFGYDHASGYVSWTGRRPRSYRLVLGDYRMDFGQGLLLGGGYSLGKTSGVSGASFGSGDGPRPSGSTSESGFFRGGAAAVHLTESLEVWAFVSDRRHDGVPAPSPEEEGEDGSPQEPASDDAPTEDEGATAARDSVGTVRTSGLHRTLLESAPRRTLAESSAGGALGWRRGPVRIGALLYRTSYRPPVAPADRLDRRFAFRGEEAVLVSTSASLLLPHLHLFGEIARSPGGAPAGLGGGRFALGARSELTVHLRRYPAAFQSLHGRAFAEQSGAPGNEHGLYAGLLLRPSDRWEVRAYVDEFSFPWLRYATPRPSTGHEAYLRLTRSGREDRMLLVQVRSKLREEATEAEADPLLLGTVAARIRRTARLEWTGRPQPDLRLRLRTEGARSHALDAPPSHGLSAFADLRWTPTSRLRVDLRETRFHTDGYAGRVYQLESDLYYAFRAPALFGRGRRAYLLVSWFPIDGLQLQAKYGHTRVHDRDRMGSGWEELSGDRLRELRFQVRWTRTW